jgi:predicted amidohydrolase
LAKQGRSFCLRNSLLDIHHSFLQRGHVGELMMTRNGFRLALVQMRVNGGEKVQNLARAKARVAEAAAGGAACVLLPECLDLGWTHPSSLTEAEPIPGGYPCALLCRLAREHGVFVCAGLTERAGERVYNAAVLIDRDGRVLLVHRKLNELEIGHEFYSQGDRLGVCETELGTIGLVICADGFAEGCVLTRSLGYMGADVILSPSAWARPADHDNTLNPYGKIWRDSYMPVARDFSLWIAAASNVGPITAGPWQGRKCIGCSMVIGPDGREMLQGPYGEDADCILYTEITPVPRPARGDAWKKHWAEEKNHGSPSAADGRAG